MKRKGGENAPSCPTPQTNPPLMRDLLHFMFSHHGSSLILVSATLWSLQMPPSPPSWPKNIWFYFGVGQEPEDLIRGGRPVPHSSLAIRLSRADSHAPVLFEEEFALLLFFQPSMIHLKITISNENSVEGGGASKWLCQ